MSYGATRRSRAAEEAGRRVAINESMHGCSFAPVAAVSEKGKVVLL